jgi:hypothetical protein
MNFVTCVNSLSHDSEFIAIGISDKKGTTVFDNFYISFSEINSNVNDDAKMCDSEEEIYGKFNFNHLMRRD